MGTVIEEDFLLGRDFSKMKSWDRLMVKDGSEPIEALKPKSDFHEFILCYLLKRIEESEREMGNFYDRWNANEKKMQAYIDLPASEKLAKDMNEQGKVPQVVSIHVPLTYAIVSTITTFLMHVFTGRRPIFQVGSYKDEGVQAAQAMEMTLQYQADHMRFTRQVHNNAQDGQVYGVQIMRNEWVQEYGMRTRRANRPIFSLFGKPIGSKVQSQRERALVYEGNMGFAQDPFMFFPDPKVPMAEVNRRGEYVFWRNYEGRHHLLSMQAEGAYKWVEAVNPKMPVPEGEGGAGSQRSLRAEGESHPGEASRALLSNAIQVDEGTIEIIPDQLGLGRGTKPEKWLFTIGNKSQIIQAKPFDTDHNMHPVQVAEPYSLGYGFGHLGLVDLIAPLGDHLSWLFNSRMDNVRRVLNDVFVVDPLSIEMPDLRQSGPGKIIRLKRGAASRDVRMVLQQLAVTDVTASHVADAQIVIRLAQMLSAVTDNVLGMQDQTSSRKTATEVRSSGQAAISRLANQAKIISAMQKVDVAQHWCLNTQQFMSDDFAVTLLGAQGEKFKITPDMLSGDFHFPLHDGTLPLDRVALLDVWKEIMSTTLADPQLRQTTDVPKMFQFIAELGGAQNYKAFQLQVSPDAQLEQQAQAGNVVPLPKTKNTMNERPADRAVEALA